MARSPRQQRLKLASQGPAVWLLDATAAGTDERALREQARAFSAAAHAKHVSRSYCHPYALIAWHDAPVGVDIERVGPCDPAFADSIATPSERRRPPEVADRDRHVTALWSSKEALAKALGDALDYDPRRLESPMHWPDLQAGPWRAAALDVPDPYVAWVCWRLQRRAVVPSCGYAGSMEPLRAGDLVTVATAGPQIDGIVFDVPSASKVVVALIDRRRGPVLRTVQRTALTDRAEPGPDDKALRQLMRRTAPAVHNSAAGGRSGSGLRRAGYARAATHRSTGR